MPLETRYKHISMNDAGVPMISGTTMKVVELALEYLANGWSPEEIHFQHPHLSLAQIYGALTYYYENQEQLDEQIKVGLAESDRFAEHVADTGFQRRLRDLKQPR